MDTFVFYAFVVFVALIVLTTYYMAYLWGRQKQWLLSAFLWGYGSMVLVVWIWGVFPYAFPD